MRNRLNKGFKSVAWLFYLLIVFEIIYMISPFALYYYSSYGPALNFLHQWPLTAWVTGFFLPHYTESSLWILNHVSDIGGIIFSAGLVLFLTGAAQIYYSKFFKKKAVTAGLYRFIRHPQYSAFSIMGLGVLLIWSASDLAPLPGSDHVYHHVVYLLLFSQARRKRMQRKVWGQIQIIPEKHLNVSSGRFANI
jgi:protein-S-isoprenylcysteine O-methyltransferase Ste14